jgi:phage-related protein
MAPEAYEAPFRRWERHDFLRPSFDAAQLGEMSVKAKPLHGLGGLVMEIAAYDASGTDCAVYTVSIGESIYVIHAFQTKSKSGIATPKSEMELIRQRLRQLRSEVKDAEERSP